MQAMGLLAPEANRSHRRRGRGSGQWRPRWRIPLARLADRLRTQTNMNVNEVIANRAIEAMGGVLAARPRCTPTPRQPAASPSNDTLSHRPSYGRGRRDRPRPDPRGSAGPDRGAAAEGKGLCRGDQGGPHPSPGRGSPQPRQEFSGYRAQLEARPGGRSAVLPRLRELAIGRQRAVGTGLNAPAGFVRRWRSG